MAPNTATITDSQAAARAARPGSAEWSAAMLRWADDMDHRISGLIELRARDARELKELRQQLTRT
jgi:hypothetical protein